jgi:hypothetical protein
VGCVLYDIIICIECLLSCPTVVILVNGTDLEHYDAALLHAKLLNSSMLRVLVFLTC